MTLLIFVSFIIIIIIISDFGLVIGLLVLK